MAGFRDVRKWRLALDQEKNNLQAVIREAAPAVARYTRDTIRERIPPDNTSTSGMSNPFPGYAATGRMKSTIVAGPVRRQGKTFVARVGLAANARKLDKQKAYVHEYGMIIKARRAPFLVFQIDGKWIRVKQVRIRAKRFFRSGWAEAQKYFPEILGNYIKQRWPRR